MNNKTKTEIFDRIAELFREETDEKKILPCAGTLSRAQGINGFKKCEVGTPVYERGDRYILFMESLDGKTVVETPYLKEDLARAMNIGAAASIDQ